MLTKCSPSCEPCRLPPALSHPSPVPLICSSCPIPFSAELDSPQPDQLGPHTARDRAWSCFPTSTSPLPCHSSSLLCSCCPMPSVPFPGAAPALQLGTIPRQGVLQVFMDTTCTWMATSAPQVTKMSYPDLTGCSAGLQNSPESPLLVHLPSPQPQDKPQHLGNLMASEDSGLSTLALVFELCYPSTYNPAQGDWRQTSSASSSPPVVPGELIRARTI